jgi:hypothetical protein
MKCYKDFREFLSVLDQARQLLRIKDEVKFEPDLVSAGAALAQIGDAAPAILFDKIAGCIDVQVAMNVHGSWPNHALALGMDEETSLKEQFFEFVRRFKLFPGELERVPTAPWQDVAVEKDINLFDILPLFRLSRGDGGYYVDKACTISRDPEDWDNDDVENVGVYRLMVQGPRRVAIQPVPQHDIAIHINHAEARGEDLRIAISISNEPIILLMGATPLLYTQLEYKMAAVMQGEPYEVVKTAKASTSHGARNTFWKAGCSRGNERWKVPSASFRDIIPAAIDIRSSRSTAFPIGRTPLLIRLCRAALDRARLSSGDDHQCADLHSAQHRRRAIIQGGIILVRLAAKEPIEILKPPPPVGQESNGPIGLVCQTGTSWHLPNCEVE